MPTASITIAVSSFVQGGCCPVSSITVSDTGGNRVYQKTGSQAVYIKSKGKSALTIQFIVVGNGGPYTVTGIAFSGVLSDANGAATFGTPAYSANTATVDDTFAAQPTWNYTITIQNPSGQLGMIDPGITNTDEN